jgi:hypothetical protein
VLKTLGLRRSQLLRLVSWQASALAAASLLVGLPLGLLAGRWAWLVFADSAGVGKRGRHPSGAGAPRHPGDAHPGQPHRRRPGLDRRPGQAGQSAAR